MLEEDICVRILCEVEDICLKIEAVEAKEGIMKVIKSTVKMKKINQWRY